MPPRKASRDQLLNQPRSGARPLGGSPGPPRPPRDAGSRADVRAARERYRSGRSPEDDARLRDRAVTDARAAQNRESQREEMRSGAREDRRAGASPRATRRDLGGSAQPAGGASRSGGSAQRQRKMPGLPRSTRRGGDPGKSPAYHNYQAIILAEFVAAELLVAATPIATKKNKPGLSPYVPRDLVKLIALGLVYFILQLVASGGRGAGRISAWFGALVLLAVGLNEAADLAKVFDVLSGGSGKPKITTVADTGQQASQPLTSFVPPVVGNPPGGGQGGSPSPSSGRRQMTGPPQAMA